jgi:hypothetical protein
MTVRASISFVLFCLLSSAFASAQVPASGEIQGSVTTQAHTVPLPGAHVTVNDQSDRQVAEVACGEDGHFRVPNVPPGRYRVSASLDGFETARVDAVVAAGKTTDLSLDLPIGSVKESVDVVATPSAVGAEGGISKPETIGGKEMEQFAPTGGLQATLRLLASIIEVPGGVSIKGGRPSQAGIQLGSITLVDPSTGLSQVSLPDDAIDSVAVLPNPYEVEYGRFSSGLVVIQTRRASDEWKIRLNNIDPTFRTDRQNPVDVIGVGLWAPRIEVGGPLIKDRLFLEQTAQFRYNTSDIWSLPENEVRVSKAFSSFTRVDANLSPSHTLVATGGVFPGVVDWATLGTFTPYNATVNLHNNAGQVALTERAVWTDSLFAETTVQMHDYDTDVLPQGSAPMMLLPDTTNGNFFNQQHRHTNTYQLIESVSTSRDGPGGLHLFKFGFDLLENQYDGTSVSQPVLIETDSGILTRRLDFSGPTAQSINSTDAALFAQDRFQPNTRWSAEFGGRIDYDGVVNQVNLTPRVGAVLRLDDSGSATLRGGFGLFFEQTPSIAGAFDQFENVVDTRYASDGLTPIALPVQFVRAISGLETPRSQTWDVGYDQRLNRMWSVHVGGIDRRGSHEEIVQAVQTGAATGQLLLSSTGTSSYREADIGINFTYGSTADFHASYARSEALGDLNTLTNYMNAIMWPVVGANQYTIASTDVPNRLLARGRLMPTPRWLLLGTFDWHDGLPYSVVNDTLDYVGARDSLRYPTFVRLEVGLERRFKILKFQPWIGVRVWNALNHFNPTDVQNNLISPYFGGFYNSEYRQFRLQVRFER